MSNIINAVFLANMDNGFCIRSNCNLDLDTKEVVSIVKDISDVEMDDLDDSVACEREYVQFNGEEHTVEWSYDRKAYIIID